MHLPDGFISAPVIVTTTAVSVTVTAAALSRTRREIDEKRVPALGVITAFLFAAQMINFPVAGGTSGHLLGAFLAMVLLGPYLGFLAMVIVLVLQALLFADGGVVSLGTNLFNMGVVGGVLPYLLFRTVAGGRPPGKRPLGAAAFFAWLSVVLAAAACAVELVLSGTSPVRIVLPAMLGVHGIIGIGEAIITFSFLSLIAGIRPDLLYGLQPAGRAGGSR